MARPRWADMVDSSAEDLGQPAVQRPRWADMADSSVEDMSQHMSPPVFQDTYEDREGASQELLGERLEDAELEEPDAILEDAEAEVEAGAAATARPRPTSSLSRARPFSESDVGEALHADGTDRKRSQAASTEATPAFKRRRTPNSLEETPDESDPTAASSSSASGSTAASSSSASGSTAAASGSGIAASSSASSASSAAPSSSQPQGPTEANAVLALAPSSPPQTEANTVLAVPSPGSPQPPADDNVERVVQKRRAVVSAHKRRPDYLAFAAARPRDLRTPDEPMTPDTEETQPKRQWESRIQRWRQGIRDWYAANGNGSDQESEAA